MVNMCCKCSLKHTVEMQVRVQALVEKRAVSRNLPGVPHTPILTLHWASPSAVRGFQQKTAGWKGPP